jgi:hypothetical protein
MKRDLSLVREILLRLEPLSATPDQPAPLNVGKGSAASDDPPILKLGQLGETIRPSSFWRLAPRPAGLFFSHRDWAHNRRQLFANAAIAASRVSA